MGDTGHQSGRWNYRYSGSLFMRLGRVSIWLLLSYLALLWNVVPSAHHAEIFGFHDHCAHLAIDLALEAGCGCCHHAPLADDGLLDGGHVYHQLSVGAACDCMFCWYFDHFNAIEVQHEADLPDFLLCCVAHTAGTPTVSAAILQVARGPPV